MPSRLSSPSDTIVSPDIENTRGPLPDFLTLVGLFCLLPVSI
jgi:hypothetical protein